MAGPGRGRGGYAVGRKAIGLCERSGKKMLRRTMVYDGQFPDLLVAPDEWDPKHPQEYLPDVTDPVVIYDPTGDTDKVAANTLVISIPLLDWTTNDRVPNPLRVSLGVNDRLFNWNGGSLVDA